jgi:hypothetical protein
MPSIIIVEKLGNIKSVQLKNYDESELYKKAGFKTADGFKCHTNWTVDIESNKYVICVYGKTNGKANQENKYEFPPPIDNTLFFGNCVIIKKLESDPSKIADLTDSGWNAIYETLYGGFEDLGDEDSDEEDDSDEDPSLPRTKNGYVKDGFVVDDDEVEDEEDEEDEDEDVDDEEEVYVKKTSAKNTKAKAKNTKTNAIKSIFDLKSIEELATPSQENYLGCTSELVEEDYV